MKGPVAKTDLEMHFTVNLAFVNYFDDMIEELGIQIFMKLNDIGTNPAIITQDI